MATYECRVGLKVKSFEGDSSEWGSGYPSTANSMKQYAEDYSETSCVDIYIPKVAGALSNITYSFDTEHNINDVTTVSRLKVTFRFKIYNRDGFDATEPVALQMYYGSTAIGTKVVAQSSNNMQLLTIDNIPVPTDKADLANYKIKVTAKRSADDITTSSSLEQYGATMHVYYTSSTPQTVDLTDLAVMKSYIIPFPEKGFYSITGAVSDTHDLPANVLDETCLDFNYRSTGTADEPSDNNAPYRNIVDFEFDYSHMNIDSTFKKVTTISLKIRKQVDSRGTTNGTEGVFVLGDEVISFPITLGAFNDYPEQVTITHGLLKREIPVSRLSELKFRITTKVRSSANNPSHLKIYGLTMSLGFTTEDLDTSLYEYFLANKFTFDFNDPLSSISNAISNTWGLADNSSDSSMVALYLRSGAGTIGHGRFSFDFTNIPNGATRVANIQSKIRFGANTSKMEFIRFQWFWKKYPISNFVYCNINSTTTSVISVPLEYLPTIEQLPDLALRVSAKKEDAHSSSSYVEIYAIETKVTFDTSGTTSNPIPVEEVGNLGMLGASQVLKMYIGSTEIQAIYLGDTALISESWDSDVPNLPTGDEPEEVPEGSGLPCTYSIYNDPADTYPFALNDAGYWESTNKGVSDSYSMCRVDFYANGRDKLCFDCIHSGETTYDYAAFSLIDGDFSKDNKVSDSQISVSLSGNHSVNVNRVKIGRPVEGNHSIWVKYRKDSSVNNGNDSLQFKVVFLTPEEEGIV